MSHTFPCVTFWSGLSKPKQTNDKTRQEESNMMAALSDSTGCEKSSGANPIQNEQTWPLQPKQQHEHCPDDDEGGRRQRLKLRFDMSLNEVHFIPQLCEFTEQPCPQPKQRQQRGPDDDGGRRQRLKLHFDMSLNEVYFIPQLCEFTEQDIDDRWISYFEREMIKHNNIFLANMMKTGKCPFEDASGGVYTFRGLENLTGKGMRVRKEHRVRAFNALRKEQKRQQLQGHTDPEILGRKMRRATLESTVIAACRGKADAEEVTLQIRYGGGGGGGGDKVHIRSDSHHFLVDDPPPISVLSDTTDRSGVRAVVDAPTTTPTIITSTTKQKSAAAPYRIGFWRLGGRSNR